jgi:hypothetical protein
MSNVEESPPNLSGLVSVRRGRRCINNAVNIHVEQALSVFPKLFYTHGLYLLLGSDFGLQPN